MNKLKLGVIGAGGIARRRTIPAMLRTPNVEVVAVMAPSGAVDIAEEFGVPEHFDDVGSLLAHSSAEAVYIASPVFAHLEQILAAARSGKHILCEKPVGRNPDETRQATEACETAGVTFMEAYMMKFHGAHAKARQMVRSGKIGRPVSLRAQLTCWYPPHSGAWRQDPELGGGGSLIDMATHCFDLLEFVGGARINGVFAMTTNQVHQYASEDSATMLLRFENGSHGVAEAFFCIPDEASLNRLEIFGSSGAIFSEGTIGQTDGGRMHAALNAGGEAYDAAQNRAEQGVFQEVAFQEVNPYTGECEYFAQCVLEGRKPELNGIEDALQIAAVTDAAYRSWREKRFVQVPPQRISGTPAG